MLVFGKLLTRLAWRLATWRVPPLRDKSGSLCLNCTQNMVYAKYLLSYLVWNFGTRQREAAYVTSLQYNPKALESLVSFLGC